MSSATPLTVCQFEKAVPLNLDALRKGAFSDVPDPDGKKAGWVGLGQPLDTENFFLASADTRFSGFSYRLDSRKPSGAVVRLKLAEKIRDEEAAGKTVGSKRKKELREAIYAALASRANYVPTLTDCVWDAQKGRLFIASVSDALVERVLAAFSPLVDQTGAPLEPEKYMPEVFSQIQKENGLRVGAWNLSPLGDAKLSSDAAAAEKSSVAVQNNPEAVSEALNKGLTINKMALVCEKSDSETAVNFYVDSSLRISRLALPKAEKGAEEETTFLINSETCAVVADILETVSR